MLLLRKILYLFKSKETEGLSQGDFTLKEQQRNEIWFGKTLSTGCWFQSQLEENFSNKISKQKKIVYNNLNNVTCRTLTHSAVRNVVLEKILSSMDPNYSKYRFHNKSFDDLATKIWVLDIKISFSGLWTGLGFFSVDSLIHPKL